MPGYDHGPWNGFLAPARTPRAIIARLNEETARICTRPKRKSVFLNEGAEPVGDKPEAFAAMIKGGNREVGEGHQGRGYQGGLTVTGDECE